MDPRPANAPVRIGTITSSDTRTPTDDVSGDLLREGLRGAGFALVAHRIVREDGVALRDAVREWVDGGSVDAIVVTGGTGVGPRDVTLDVLEPLFTRKLDGFGEAFRRLSWDEMGPRSILSRASAGVVGSVVVVALPGSPGAVRLGLSALIVPVLAHAVDVVNGRGAHAHARHAGAKA
jgi:molybdopterin adenylyltransferase